MYSFKCGRQCFLSKEISFSIFKPVFDDPFDELSKLEVSKFLNVFER